MLSINIYPINSILCEKLKRLKGKVVTHTHESTILKSNPLKDPLRTYMRIEKWQEMEDEMYERQKSCKIVAHHNIHKAF